MRFTWLLQPKYLQIKKTVKRAPAPAPPGGKAASSHNATADGFFAADPVLPSEDRNHFNGLLEGYNSDFAPTTAHEEFLVSQMTGARWKLDRVERIEVAIFTALDNQGDPATADARMAEALLEKDFAKRLACLERARTILERTYHRSVRELRATRKEQNKANSTQTVEKQFEKLLKKMNEEPPPDALLQALAEARRASIAKNAKSQASTWKT